MKALLTNAITAVKGFLMGAANVIPGVSGGTMALITGIYGEIIDALNALTAPQTWKALLHGRFREFWGLIHGTFLLSLGIGVIISIFSLAKLMIYVLEHHPVQTWAFFFGLIIASAVLMVRDLPGHSEPSAKKHIGDVVFALAGAAIGVLVCLMTPTQTPDSLWFIAICGAVSICAMVLPGISGSFILVILGKYDYVMAAISNLDIAPLVVFAIGCAVGILAFAKLIHWLLGRWERRTLLVLLGFILGSLIKVWPWSNTEAIAASQGLAVTDNLNLHIGGACLWCIAGAALVAAIDILGKITLKRQKTE